MNNRIYNKSASEQLNNNAVERQRDRPSAYCCQNFVLTTKSCPECGVICNNPEDYSWCNNCEACLHCGDYGHAHDSDGESICNGYDECFEGADYDDEEDLY